MQRRQWHRYAYRRLEHNDTAHAAAEAEDRHTSAALFSIPAQTIGGIPMQRVLEMSRRHSYARHDTHCPVSAAKSVAVAVAVAAAEAEAPGRAHPPRPPAAPAVQCDPEEHGAPQYTRHDYTQDGPPVAACAGVRARARDVLARRAVRAYV